jgi:hypothetical protein
VIAQRREIQQRAAKAIKLRRHQTIRLSRVKTLDHITHTGSVEIPTREAEILNDLHQIPAAMLALRDDCRALRSHSGARVIALIKTHPHIPQRPNQTVGRHSREIRTLAGRCQATAFRLQSGRQLNTGRDDRFHARLSHKGFGVGRRPTSGT